MKGGGAPAAPNYSGLIGAATDQANKYNALMQQELDFAKGAYNDQLPYTQKIQALNLDTAQNASDFAKSQQAQYQQLYQPLQAKFVQQAQDYNSPDEVAKARGAAMGTVGQQFDAAGDAAKRSLESYGIDPSATRFAALDVGTRTAKAAATAAAGTQSDVQRQLTGLGLEGQALNIGNGLPGQIAAGQNTSTAAGAAGNAAGNSTYSTYSGALGNPTAFGALGNQSLGLAGQLTGQQYQGQLGQFNANQSASSGIGSLLGAGLGAAGSIFGGPIGGFLGSALGNIGGSALGGGSGITFADGGAVPVAGSAVPTDMSPSGGAQTDDVSAQVGPALPGAPAPQAKINAGEFIFPKDVANWLGEEKLQKMIVKAREAKAQAGAKPQQAPAPSAPSSQALQIGGPHMAAGGVVPAPARPPMVAAVSPASSGAHQDMALPVRGPALSNRSVPTAHVPRAGIPHANVPRIVVAAPGAGGGAGHISALPVGRRRMPAPYPGGSGAGAVRSAIPGV